MAPRHTIPAAYAAPALRDAYERGFDHGHGLACHNRPRLGDKLFVESLGRVVVDAGNIREVHEALCFEAESHSRCYSPFEFTAHEFNSADRELEPEFLEADGDLPAAWIVPDENGDNLAGEDFPSREAAQAWIDAQPSSDELWEAFDAGIGDAIAADLAEYTDEDYEIETETTS